jgi:regulator of RNase E activity RraB
MASEDADRQVIEALRQAGADLSQPRDVRHYLYVPNEKIATLLGPRIEQIGFTVDTRPEAEGSRWLILISGTAMVTAEEIASFRKTFEALAEKAGGEYDGWEAAASP